MGINQKNNIIDNIFQNVLVIIKCVIIVLISSLLGLILMLLVYWIPTQNIRDNAFKSSYIFEKEGDGPKIWYFYSTALDNFTDALMILEAANDKEDTLIDKALLNYFEETSINGEDKNPCWSLVDIAKNNITPIENMRIYDFGYGRYWHGYLVWLKPLLVLMSYKWIRIINTVIQISIALFILYRLYIMKYRYLALGYLMCMLILCPIASGMSMQFSSCYYIFSIGNLIMLTWCGKCYNKKKCLYLFLLLGICTSFFDFLTYPITTLFIPYIFSMIFWGDIKLKKQIERFVVTGIIWCLGYVGMWSMKWIWASLLTGENVISSAVASIVMRTSATNGSVIMGVIRNVGVFIINPFTIITLVIVIYITIKIRLTLDKQHDLICIFIMMMPIVWYCFASNHSYNHFWFTFRNMIISVLSFFALIQRKIDNVEIGNEQ